MSWRSSIHSECIVLGLSAKWPWTYQLATGQAGGMERRQLGSGPWVSAIGMGGMGLSQGYGPASDAESVRAIHQALEAGVTLLDTAMSYGQGHNEELVGRALAGWAGASGSP